jgi:hypothetical protein
MLLRPLLLALAISVLAKAQSTSSTDISASDEFAAECLQNQAQIAANLSAR